MIKVLKIVSITVIIVCLCLLLYMKLSVSYNIYYHNNLIDNGFRVYNEDYLGYIIVPRLEIKRLIKNGNDKVMDDGYVLKYSLSSLASDDLIILAGHNIVNVFSKLHDIRIGDEVILYCGSLRKFVVYDFRVIDENDFSYFENRKNELLLITCDKKKKRFIVRLREVL